MTNVPDRMWRETVPKSNAYPDGGAFYHETKPTSVQGELVPYVREDLSLAEKLYQEYIKVDDWYIQPEDGSHASKFAIRRIAVRLGVYSEFCEFFKDKSDAH